MKTYDVGVLDPASEEAQRLAREAMGLVPVAPAHQEPSSMETQLAEQEKAYVAMLQGLKMLRGGVRRHQAAREAAGRIAADEGIANPISSTMAGANMPYSETDYMTYMLELATRKIKAGQPLDKDGLSSP